MEEAPCRDARRRLSVKWNGRGLFSRTPRRLPGHSCAKERNRGTHEAGGKGFERYELYKKAKTIAEARAGESTYSEQIANHLQRELRALGAVRCRAQCMLMLSLQTIRDHPGCDAVKSGAAPKRRFISRTPWIGACCLTVCFQASTSVVRVPGSLILVPFCFHRTIRTDCESHAWAHCFISDYDSSCRQAFCFHCHSFRNLANS